MQAIDKQLGKKWYNICSIFYQEESAFKGLKACLKGATKIDLELL